MSGGVRLIAVLTALPGKSAELRNLLDAMIAPSRAEQGNLRYDAWRDRDREDCFVLDELYADESALIAHRASGHFQDYLGRIGTLAERTALTIEPLDVEEAS